MAQIIKTEVQTMPRVKLIGKRYTDKDRNQYGTFADQWGKWFTNNWFQELKVCHGLQGVSDDYIGAIRCTGNGFEYWIGIFMAEDDVAPQGFDEIIIEPTRLFVSYIYGNEQTGEIYGEKMTHECYKNLSEQGYKEAPHAWNFERYNCPRFTQPDDKGNVILDYLICIE